MLRSLASSLAVYLVLCATAAAQQRSDPARLHPITVPIRDAGFFDWSTKQWLSGPQATKLLASQYPVYRNDCTWPGGSFHVGIDACEILVDTGRLPSTSTPPSSLPGMDANGVHIQSGVTLSGVTDDQIIGSFQFGYCTYNTQFEPTNLAFYDKLRGDCAGGIPVLGKPYNLSLSSQAIPFGTGTAYFNFASASGFALPASSIAGQQSCWTLTIGFPNNAGFCMQSEGEGTWDNHDDEDKFSWSFGHHSPSQNGHYDGPILAGEPNAGGWGAGSYNIPAGPDPFGGPCGTGFDSHDGWWLNVHRDGPSPGNQGSCNSTNPNGTGCYWFGGWPGNALGSFWMVLRSPGSCSGCSNRPETYCTAGTSASGCQALISATGTSSATAASGFFLNAVNVEGNRDGLFFFGTNGRQATSWGTGSSTFCMVPPVNRADLNNGVGSNGTCDGVASTDLNARWAAKPNQNPGVGAVVQGQFWYRDPFGAGNKMTTLSNAVEWTVCP
jgi:hypothetical protein